MPRRRDSPLDPHALRRLLDDQSGVVSRAQLVSLGADDTEVRRLLRRRELVARLPGVYVEHDAEPTWTQRAWMGVLLCSPATLDRDSALRADNGPGWRGRPDHLPIQLAIDVGRRIRSAPGYDVRRVTGLDAKARWNLGPPRMRSEEATLDSALAAASAADTFEALARAVRARITTPDRLLDQIAARQRVPARAALVAALQDLRDGTTSVLERGYLTRVERAHGLPRGTRQVREDGVCRDVVYARPGVVVELDGVRDHTQAPERHRDLARDLAVAASGRVTVRLGWRQVFDESCGSAVAMAAVLRQRGWEGRPRRCGPGCAVVSTA